MYTLSLRLVIRFYNPCGIRVSLKLLQKNGVFSWKHIRLWNEIQVRTPPNIVLREIMLILLQLFLISLDILDHEVLAGEFVVVGEVVDDLAIVKTDSCVFFKSYLFLD